MRSFRLGRVGATPWIVWGFVRRHGRRAYKRTARATLRRVHVARHGGASAGDLSAVRTREQIPDVLNRRGLVGAGVEVGVKRGAYSEFLLRHWRGHTLISVDPWREAPTDEYLDRANVEQDEQESYYTETRRRLARFGTRSEVWRTTSVEAAGRVADASLDFVYIDARHDRESVLEDLATWFPKLRRGAIFAGHDYADGEFPNGVFGVKSAVDEFFGERGIRVHATDGGPRVVEHFASWLVEIPG
jgi:hypothetical protein